jgi:hypothetical protein
LRGLRPERHDEPRLVLGPVEDPPAVAWTKGALSAMALRQWPTLRIHDRDGHAVSEPDFPDPPTATFVKVRNRLAVMTGTIAPWQTTGQRTGTIHVLFEGRRMAFQVVLVDALTIDLIPIPIIDPHPPKPTIP